MEYELLFFTSVANEDKIGLIKKDIAEILENLGGRLSSEFTDIGKRKLAYPIKRNTHAFYSWVRFELDNEKKQNIPEIEKRLNLYDKIMRHLIVRASEVGKPVTSREIKFEKEEKVEEKTAEPKEKPRLGAQFITPKPEKATFQELDEKLNEILEETPK